MTQPQGRPAGRDLAASTARGLGIQDMLLDGLMDVLWGARGIDALNPLASGPAVHDDRLIGIADLAQPVQRLKALNGRPPALDARQRRLGVQESRDASRDVTCYDT